MIEIHDIARRARRLGLKVRRDPFGQAMVTARASAARFTSVRGTELPLVRLFGIDETGVLRSSQSRLTDGQIANLLSDMTARENGSGDDLIGRWLAAHMSVGLPECTQPSAPVDMLAGDRPRRVIPTPPHALVHALRWAGVDIVDGPAMVWFTLDGDMTAVVSTREIELWRTEEKQPFSTLAASSLPAVLAIADAAAFLAWRRADPRVVESVAFVSDRLQALVAGDASPEQVPKELADHFAPGALHREIEDPEVAHAMLVHCVNWWDAREIRRVASSRFPFEWFAAPAEAASLSANGLFVTSGGGFVDVRPDDQDARLAAGWVGVVDPQCDELSVDWRVLGRDEASCGGSSLLLCDGVAFSRSLSSRVARDLSALLEPAPWHRAGRAHWATARAIAAWPGKPLPALWMGRLTPARLRHRHHKAAARLRRLHA